MRKIAIQVIVGLAIGTAWLFGTALAMTDDTLAWGVLLTVPIVTYIVGVWVGRRSTITPSPHP